ARTCVGGHKVRPPSALLPLPHPKATKPNQQQTFSHAHTVLHRGVLLGRGVPLRRAVRPAGGVLRVALPPAPPAGPDRTNRLTGGAQLKCGNHTCEKLCHAVGPCAQGSPFLSA